MSDTTLQLAERIVAEATKAGAQQCSAVVTNSRFIDLRHREGDVETIRESSSAGVGINLYVDGRYASHATSDLRWEALAPFISQAVAMTRLLAPDPHRGLADPSLYANRPEVDLGLWDTAYDTVDTDRRREIAAELDAIALKQDKAIISVTSGYYDSVNQVARVHSNGFSGTRRSCQFWYGAEVSVEDAEGRKPEDYFWVGGRALKKLPATEVVA